MDSKFANKSPHKSSNFSAKASFKRRLLDFFQGKHRVSQNSEEVIHRRRNQIIDDIIPRKCWFWLIIIIVLTFGLVVWSILWVLPINIKGKGIFIRPNPVSNSVVLVAFFPYQQGKNIHKGNIISMLFADDDQKEYRYILSRIKDVSEFSVSQKGIQRNLENSDLMQYVSNQGPLIQILAEPIVDPHSLSLVHLPQAKKNMLEIFEGLAGDVEVTVEQIHPIYYLIPLKEFKSSSFGEHL